MEVHGPIDKTACTVQTKGWCQHSDTLTTVVHKQSEINEWKHELKADLKEIKESLHVIQQLRTDQTYAKEATTRAFQRIETLERGQMQFQHYLDKLEGMKTMAWILWLVLTSGVGVALAKLFAMSPSP